MVDFETKMRELAMFIYATSGGKQHCKTIYASETKFRENVNDNKNKNITKWLRIFFGHRHIFTLNKRK